MEDKIRIDYKEGGFSLIWFDKDLKRLQMMTTGESIGKTILSIKEQGISESFTFQAYLKHLNDAEPKSDFHLWKAMELAKFVKTRMREDLIHWLNNPEEWESQKI